MKTRVFIDPLTHLTERSHMAVTRARVRVRAIGTNPTFRQMRQRPQQSAQDQSRARQKTQHSRPGQGGLILQSLADSNRMPSHAEIFQRQKPSNFIFCSMTR